MNKNTLKSVGAVFAGILVIVVLSIGTDLVMHATGVFPALGQPMSDAFFLLATSYRTIYSIAGGYITARRASEKPMQHALVLGAIGMALGIVGAVATWNRGPAFGPHWYPVALVVLAVPQCWAGAKLRLMQLPARSEG